ncbi:hypothetical protein [Bacillus sp. S14(2024)]|uniref:hypothetical protein n=1 Tax=Bacillus sp. S14(2024) TaxID=3162884 RepID=UPI003D21B1D3
MSIASYLKRIYINQVKDHINEIDPTKLWAFLSYIPEPYMKKSNSKYMLKHQNRREAILIGETFNELGYNTLNMRFDKKFSEETLYQKQCKIVFGIEPNFREMAQSCKSALKIYYATGAYYSHQNHMVISRTDDVNERKQSNIPYKRLVGEHNSIDIADYVIQIGSDLTIDTYPEQYKEKIFPIRQSSFEFLNLDFAQKSQVSSNQNYLWFGSHGSILKGLDLVLEFFSNNPSLNLHVIGNVDREFEQVFHRELHETKNIHFHGYIPINGLKLLEIANKCAFIIFPSGSEGGLPGSVINMMRLGLIPIVSRYAADNNVKELGVLMNDVTMGEIEKAIHLSQEIDKNEIMNLYDKNYKYVKENYNLEIFKMDLATSLQKILKRV